MKTQKRRKKSSSPAQRRRFPIITVGVAAVVVAIAGITVLSKQLGNQRQTTSANAATSSPGPKYVTVKVAGREVQVDPQTGQLKPMTAEKAQEIAEVLKSRLNKSTDDLPQIQNADGSVSIDLEGRAQNVVLARRNADGSTETSCVDEPLAAAEFLGIDPKLVGVDVSKRANGQTIVRTPAKKAIQ